MANLIGVVIPTWNNNNYLIPCVFSILSPFSTEDLFHVYVVNNGDPKNMEGLSHPRLTILQQEKNLGWEGGLKAGLAASSEEFVVFMNDDTLIPLPSVLWLNHLVNHFADPKVGAVGPSSNCVMGIQSIFANCPTDVVKVNFLVNFCCMVRRKALDEVGGVDDTLPGGDDLDLSIRLRKAGYELRADRNVFVYHHGFKTGERVNGGPNVAGGWNSIEMQWRTNWALINKHGLPAYLECMNQVPSIESPFDKSKGWVEDTEGEMVRKYVIGEKVIEIGCGMRKTVPHAIGVDRVPRGEAIPGVAPHLRSIADVTADAEGQIPVPDGSFQTVIARHILEHTINTVAALREWARVLEHGGRMIIAVPDHRMRNTIPMNYEHVRAFTPESLKDQMESLGFKTVDMLDPKNHVSFVGIFEKNGLQKT